MKEFLEKASAAPKYVLLAKHFRDQIQSGILKPGDRLPSFAQMQAQHGVGQATLERTYALLQDERIIVREANRGIFVAENRVPTALGVVGVTSGKRPKDYPYYRHLLEGIQDVAYQEKIELLLLHSGSAVNWDKMDGVLSTSEDNFFPESLPAVNLVVPSGSQACVMADDFGGAKAATDHLISLGHRRIAFLVLAGSEPRDFVIHERLRGYRSALQQAGIEPAPRWVRPLRDPWQDMASFPALGHEKMSRWLRDDWRELGCTAILAHNDDAAAGMMQAFHEAGMRVPDDVSMIGFDGTEVADQMTPRLSTVVVPLEEIGARGMRLLMRQIDTTRGALPSELPGREVVPTQLKLQQSTAKARA